MTVAATGSVSSETLKQIAMLSQGREISWTAQPTIALAGEPGPPSLSTDGVDVIDNVTMLYRIKMRENASYKTSTVTINTLDTASDYRVTIGGNVVTYDAASDTTTTTVATGLAAALQAAGAVAALVTSTSDANVVTIVGDSSADYTIVLAIVGGSGTATLSAEASTINYKFWGLPITGGTDWYVISSSGVSSNTQNITGRMNVAGFSRVFCEITSTNGTATPYVGVAILET